MKHRLWIILFSCLLLIGGSLAASGATFDELRQKVKTFQEEKKYSEALDAYKALLKLTQQTYGANNIKASDVLTEMAILCRYQLNDEKEYARFQEEAKKIRLTLNGLLKCQAPAKWAYDPGRERWLGDDPCFEFTNYRDYIKVTYYGLEGSEFKTPGDLIHKLEGLYRKFEVKDTVEIFGRTATKIQIRESQESLIDRDGEYLMPRFTYEEFILVPLKRGFLVFNFDLNRVTPLPGLFSSKEDSSKELYDDVSASYKTWDAFLKSCSITE